MSRVRAPRNCRRRPPKINCCVCTKNSISRMPPRSELDVMAFDGDFGVTAHGMDLPLHRMNVGDRSIVEIFAPDEGREIVEKPLPEREVAGNRARLDEGGALPILTDRLVIGERRPASEIATEVEPGSGRRRRSTRKT